MESFVCDCAHGRYGHSLIAAPNVQPATNRVVFLISITRFRLFIHVLCVFGFVL